MAGRHTASPSHPLQDGVGRGEPRPFGRTPAHSSTRLDVLKLKLRERHADLLERCASHSLKLVKRSL